MKVFSPYGVLESARVLVQKQCGFCNFENLDDAVRARKALNGKEFLGPIIGPVKIGFAKAPMRIPGTPIVEGGNTTISPAAAYVSLQPLEYANSVPIDETVDTAHYEPYTSALKTPLTSGITIKGIGSRTAGILTENLQPAVNLLPGHAGFEFGDATAVDALKPGGAPMPSVTEQQILIRELSGDPADLDAQSPAVVGKTKILLESSHF